MTPVRLQDGRLSHDDQHGYDHGSRQARPADEQAHTHTIEIEQAILAKNDDLAEHNRIWLADRGIAGDDKPLKYPHMWMPMSVRSGDNLETWYRWLRDLQKPTTRYTDDP